MRVTELLRTDEIVMRPPWRTFEEAVHGLVDTLVRRGRIPAPLREPAVRAIHEREQIASTAMVDIGVSIPHARIAGMDGIAVALAASPQAVFSATGVPISIVVLVLSAPELAGEHLNALATLSMVLQSEAVRRSLRHAADGPAAFTVLTGQIAG
jgi:mannitol/fructose-specific phosphotransferase system IIA component (Ntr-type)